MRPILFVLMLALAAAPACYGAYVEDDYYTESAPPPLRAEVVTVAPGPGYVWIAGHWYWTGNQYVWSRGYWQRPPAVGHVWVRSGWEQRGGRYHYIPGRWSSPRARPAHQYYRAPRPRHSTPVRPRPR